MNKAITEFKRIVQPEKTKVKDRLSFVWLFGSGADAIKDIDNVSNSLSPSNKDFKKENLFHDIKSNRARFYQWLIFNNKYDDIEYYKTPEHYPEWFTIESGYKNLIDFEMDLAFVARAIVIFSESIGAYMEIGLFSNYPEIQRRCLIISEEQYISGNNKSFYYLGSILKYKSNSIDEDISNTWGLLPEYDSNLHDEFLHIKKHIDKIFNYVIKPESLDPDDRGHQILLIIDLLDLFLQLSVNQLRKLLDIFKIHITKTDIINILSGLKVLQIVDSFQRGGTETFKLFSGYNYNNCIDFSSSKNSSFDRASFKIEIRRK